MKIDLAKSAGFCFGVKRAINIAFDTAKLNKNVHILGDIVHNEDVVRDIRSAGIKNIKKLSTGKGNVLLIRAHGTSKNITEQAKALGYKIVDATCPMVKEIHRIAISCEKQGYKIIIIGDKRHDEVRGIVGQLNSKPIIIDHIKNIPVKRLKKYKKVAVVIQSTQNLEEALKIVEFLKKSTKKLLFFNTICKPTRVKQREIKIMPIENDVMIVIGSKTSANTKRLFEISKSLNRKSYWIQNKNEIDKDWFRKAKKVGITAGASTPNYATKDVIEYIVGLKKSE